MYVAVRKVNGMQALKSRNQRSGDCKPLSSSWIRLQPNRQCRPFGPAHHQHQAAPAQTKVQDARHATQLAALERPGPAEERQETQRQIGPTQVRLDAVPDLHNFGFSAGTADKE